MKAQKRPTRYLAVCCLIAAALCCLAVFFIDRQRGPDFQEVLQQLEALPTSATAEDLEQAGFLNLTDIQAGPVREVDDFFHGTKRVLAFFTETKDGPVFQLFTFAQDKQLLVNTYSVKSRHFQAPNRTFACQVDKVAAADGITEVWLRGAPPSEGGLPDWTDYLLYRYTAK